ncbi:MAG: flavin oxidoreductase/NADH oxidase, partial [Planctomycetota bacterium]
MPSTENRFDYPTLEALRQDAERRGVDLPIGEDVGVLGEPVRWGRLTVPNRLATHPMEGCDATRDGSPSDLTLRRYRRFASGGTGMIWFEACAVVPEARANPRQLHLHAGNVRNFAEMVRQARRAARDATGRHCACVLQLTHSGRYARPEGAAAPVIAHHAPELDRACGIAPDHPLITDGELDALQEAFVAAAELAVEAGFDAVDVKACHGYLFSELLAAHTRENSRYGGSYANRVRMLRETVAKVRHASGERIEVTTRLNAYDAVAHPYGWGVDRDDPARPDLAEPIRLLGQLRGDGVAGASITAGNPYFNPHVNRPAERQGGGEHPLEGLGRFIA